MFVSAMTLMRLMSDAPYPRQRHRLVQRTVGAHPNPHGLFLRFDVCIRRPLRTLARG
jgi:hypothetical protein